MAIHIVTEANRCLNCKNPMCQQGCLVHTSIPVVIQLFKQNRLMEAGEMLFENNPLSAVCSIVCNHEKQCAGNCIRGRKDTPVHFSSIEAYISDMYLDRMIVDRPEMKKDKKVAVIGMGNAAMDVARTALRNGARHVTLYARSKNVTASSSEVAYAELDGAEFVFGMQIEKITDEGPVFKKAIFDENDQIIGYEEEPVQVHADSTIISISQTPRRKLVRTTEGLEAGERGTITVDENYMTTRPGVFAAGDVVTGAKTVVHAVDGAKKAAEAMIQYMEQGQ